MTKKSKLLVSLLIVGLVMPSELAEAISIGQICQKLGTRSTVQLKTVAALKVETLIKVDSPLHKSGCVALPKITGTGFTVTVILCGVPVQPFKHGVTSYTTVP